MKKFITTLLLIFSVGLSFSQKIYYTDFFSSMELISDSCWTDWSSWQQHFTEVEIYKDSIVVYDEDVYTIHEQLEDIIDENNITSVYRTSNRRGDHVIVRLRRQYDGVKQLYIDFKRKIYVYNLN